MAPVRQCWPARRRRRRAALRESKPPKPTPSLGQEPPLTPEYRKIYEQNLADMLKGGQGVDPTYSCVSPGMPRIMIAYAPMEVVVTAEVTYILMERDHDHYRRIYTDGRGYPANMDVEPRFLGSATDALARILGQKLNAAFGWTIVVENIAGASGQTAASNVARAAPDGYAVFVTSNTTHAANANLFKKLAYDPVGDFEPVTRLGNITLALAVNPSVPAATVAELIAYGKANPGKLSFGAGSTSARMASEMLKSRGGFEMLHVPYRANPLAVADLLGGQISLVFADISTTLPQIRAGKVKGLGVSSLQRSALAPDLPTMIDEGLPDFEMIGWFAAFVPAKTPRPVIDKLNSAFKTAMADKSVETALLTAGIEPVTSTPEELRAYVLSETKKWAEIVKTAGIEPE